VLARALAVLVGVAVAMPPVARAAPTTEAGRRRVVVLGPALDGDVSTAAASGIADALDNGLRRGAVQVIHSDTSSASCTDATCLREQATLANADAVVTVRVAASRRDYDVFIAIVDGESGSEIARVERRCELCGVAELAEHVDGQAAALLARLERPEAAPTTLTIRSQPSGAVVELDDRVVGETPVTRKVELGPHVLHLSLRGYIEETRRVEALAGVRETVDFELVPVPMSDRRRRMRAGGFAALVIGSAAAAAGLTLIGIHGQPNQTRCSGGNVDDDGDCKYLYATRVPGIVVTSIAVAALATGIGLLAAARRKRSR